MLNRKVLLGLMMSGFGLSLALPVQAQQVVLTPAGTAFLAPPVQPQQQVSPTVLKAGGVAFTMTTQEAIAPSQLASAQKQAIEKHGRFTKFQGRDIEILAPDDPRLPKVETRSPEAAGTGYIAVLDPTAEFMGAINLGAVWMIPESYILNQPKLPKFTMEDLFAGVPAPPELRDYKPTNFVGVIRVEDPILNLPGTPVVNPLIRNDLAINRELTPLPQLIDNSNVRSASFLSSFTQDNISAVGQSFSLSSSGLQDKLQTFQMQPEMPNNALVIPVRTNENLRLIPRIDHASPLSASRILPDLQR
jgi:hypothetical protein